MITSDYPIPVEPASFEEEIKKSRFITQLAHTPSPQAAKQFVEKTKAQFPGARHHCWAFVAGQPSDSMQYGFSDDGEPSGTAGKPILAQLTGSGIGEITAVVTRYSGGIKLGTGGLVKAYGGGVNNALKNLSTTTRIAMAQWVFEVPFEQLGTFEHVISVHDADILKREFGQSLLCTVACPVTNGASLLRQLHHQSKGRIHQVQT